MMSLADITVGNSGKIVNVGGSPALRRRLLDMGLTPRTMIRITKTAPMGDPLILSLRGYELTLRKEDARNIQVEDITL